MGVSQVTTSSYSGIGLVTLMEPGDTFLQTLVNLGGGGCESLKKIHFGEFFMPEVVRMSTPTPTCSLLVETVCWKLTRLHAKKNFQFISSYFRFNFVA